MREFVLSALPFVLSGAAVAIICSGMDEKKSEEEEKRMQRHIAAGAGIGIAAAVFLLQCSIWENSLGLAAGPLWGMALATLFGNHERKKKEENES